MSKPMVGTTRVGATLARRRPRQPEPRTHSVTVKLSAAELRLITSNAADARLSVRAYLATAGCRTPPDLDGTTTGESDQDREVLITLMRLHRLMRGAATNLNQAVTKWHSSNGQPPEFEAIAEYVRRITTQVDHVLSTIRPVR